MNASSSSSIEKNIQVNYEHREKLTPMDESRTSGLKRKKRTEEDEDAGNQPPIKLSKLAIGVKKYISPFAPEATIPLPFELDKMLLIESENL